AVVDQHAVGKEAAQRRFELVMMRVDEARHDDAAGGIDLRRAARLQVGSDSQNLLALDQHVGAREVAHLRIHRHHRAAADDVAPAVRAAVRRHVGLRSRRSRREKIETRGSGTGRRSAFEKSPTRTEMILWLALIAQYAHGVAPCSSRSLTMTTVRM